DLVGSGEATTQAVVSLGGVDGLRATAVLKALQLLDDRNYHRLLDNYVVFDTETTGADVDTCEVVELAAVRFQSGKGIERFQSLVSCHQPITPGAREKHGYSDADLEGKPTFAAVWSEFRAFVGDSVLVAHNGMRFDVPVLNRLAAEWGGL